MKARSDAKSVTTQIYEGQCPGTSGLRKKVTVFQQEHYLENFVQAIFTAHGSEKVKGKEFVVGGDGRFFSDVACQKICQIAAANGVKKLYVGKDTLMCTPALSCFVRKYKLSGGILLTASHNPGGPTEDFGIKFNCENGGPAPEYVTNKIGNICSDIKEYYLNDFEKIDFTKLGVVSPVEGFDVEIVDPVVDYVDMLQEIFDFNVIKQLIARPDFKFCFDGMNGVAGPYAIELFEKKLGVDAASLLRCKPLPDFGGLHPDPNLVYAKHLVDIMMPADGSTDGPDLGAACDGDADRNMILGKNFFVNPSDSVAIIAANAKDCIPYLKENFNGVARSMPTSCSLEKVAKKLGLKCYEVPTGWKFFGNLMDDQRIQICGEESFGTGGDHVREKDGLWAVLCWLSIMAYFNRDSTKALIPVKDIVHQFWSEFGKSFYSRYDYEGVSSDAAKDVMEHLLSQSPSDINSNNPDFTKEKPCVLVDNFRYEDPVDGSISEKQGVRVVFEDGARIVFRVSGTSSSGATIRMYIESSCDDASRISEETQDYLRPLIQFGLSISQLREKCGRQEPTVIT